MKNVLCVLLLAISFAACSSNSSNAGSAADSVTTITSGNSAATNSQIIPRDSVETSADSTGNIHPGDTTKK